MGDLVHLFGDHRSHLPSHAEDEPEGEPEPDIDWDLDDDLAPWLDDVMQSVRTLRRMESAIWARAFRLAGRQTGADADVDVEGRDSQLDQHWDPQVRRLAELALEAHRAAIELLEASGADQE